MEKNLDAIAKELFDKIRTQFPNLKLGDEKSNVTSEPKKARFFDFDYSHKGEKLGRISVSLSSDDGVVVIYSNDIISDKDEYVKKNFFNFLKELREFTKQHLLTFNTRDIAKSNLEKRDYKFLSKNNFGESNMSESKLFGTSMTSYQNLGNTKLIVKHSAPVNEGNPAGRAQRIQSIYIENVEGERFKYPYRHLNGARALAQHIGHGGNPYDNIGQYVIGLSEELNKLRMFKNYVDRNEVVSEAMAPVNTKVMERIDQIKKEIRTLQVSSNYEQFAESFESPTAKEIPEEIMNDWIDRLTIKSFNEELKNVFPYIFKLVDESDIPIKEINVEDLVSEEEEKEDISITAEVTEFKEYEKFLSKIVEQSDLFGDNNQDLIDQLNSLLAEPMPVGMDGTNAIESLKDIIDDKDLLDVFKELADIDPEMDVRNIIKDYVAIKDEENQTDVSSKLNFEAEPAAEVPAEPAPAAEVPAAEVPAAEVPAEPAAEPGTPPAPVMADIHSESLMSELKKLAGLKLSERVPVGGGQELEEPESQEKDLGDGFVLTTYNYGGADRKAVLDTTNDTYIILNKDDNGKALARGIGKFILINNTNVKTALSLGPKTTAAMQKAGLTEDTFEKTFEDMFGNKSNEMVEFIKSMYNKEEGSFPKGETGVIIACEKKFGDHVAPVAAKIVERLKSLGEMTKIKKMAGLK